MLADEDSEVPCKYLAVNRKLLLIFRTNIEHHYISKACMSNMWVISVF